MDIQTLLSKFEQKQIKSVMRETLGFDTPEQFQSTLLREVVVSTLFGSSITLGSGLSMIPDQALHNFHYMGRTQIGKSKAIEFQARQRVDQNQGFMLIDPKGPLFRDVLRYCVKRNQRKILIIDANPGRSHYLSFNPLKPDPGETIERCAARVVDAILSAYGETIKDHNYLRVYLKEMFYCLIFNQLTLKEARYFLLEAFEEQRNVILERTRINGRKPYAVEVLEDLYGRPKWSHDIEPKLLSIINRLGVVGSESLGNILNEGDHSISIREAVEQGYVILVNVSPGDSGNREYLTILGALILNSVFAANPKEKFDCYIDEVGFFATTLLKEVLHLGLGKKIVLHLAHQYKDQLKNNDMFKAVSNGCANKICFQLPDAADVADISRSLFGTSNDALTNLLLSLEKQWAIAKVQGEDDPRHIQIPTVPDVEISDAEVDEYLNSLYVEHNHYRTREQRQQAEAERLSAFLKVPIKESTRAPRPAKQPLKQHKLDL